MAHSAHSQVDNRVRFIAESIFNLITVTWNRDSRDWAIPSLFDQTVEKSIDEVRSYVNGSKSPGMNILEHELNNECVSVFEGVYGDYVSNGWDIRNLVSCGRCGSGWSNVDLAVLSCDSLRRFPRDKELGESLSFLNLSAHR